MKASLSLRHCLLLLIGILLPMLSYANVPIVTDSRIKTYIYNANEVFPVTVHYGYQSSIEFHPKEKIKTLSLGNSFSWKITPLENRIFIKALEGAAHTNMTVITTERTYQFEIQSRDPSDIVDDDLVYVVRFFIPNENLDFPKPNMATKRFLPKSVTQEPAINYNYTLTGPDRIAPVKVFDDKKKTYLQFANNNMLIPHIFIKGPTGQEVRVSYARKDKYIVVHAIVAEIVLRYEQDTVNVYNESYQPGQ